MVITYKSSHLDKCIELKIVTHKAKYPTFDHIGFLKWLYSEYLVRSSQEETDDIIKYVALKATIKRLNKIRKVSKSVARYASLPNS